MGDVKDKNILQTIALHMDSPTLISACVSNKDFYGKICNNRDFWDRKLNMDYPNVSNYYRMNNLTLKDPKKKYMEVFTKERELVEEYANLYVKSLSIMGIQTNIKEVINTIYLVIKNFRKLVADRLVEIRRGYPKGELIIRQVDRNNFLKDKIPETFAKEAINNAAQSIYIPDQLKEKLVYFITSAYISKNENSVYDIYKFL